MPLDPKRHVPAIALFLLGILILALRNPDPFLNPLLYAEDGVWTGLGLTHGWLYALNNARGDYFVFLNMALLLLASDLSYLVSGNPIDLLPQSIAVVSLAFFSAIATAAFVISKDAAPRVFRTALYLLLLLIPLGITQNEIFGRIVQIGFYVPIIAVLLFFVRQGASPRGTVVAIDILLLCCTATNPVVLALAFLYLAWDYFRDATLGAWFRRNATLITPHSLLLALLLSRMGGTGGVPGTFNSENLIEAALARAIEYPFVFPWYSRLSDGITLVLFAAWISLIALAFVEARSLAARRLMLFSLAAVLVCDAATLAMRPGLTGILFGYRSSYPDRYFMGINALVVLVSTVALAQLCASENARTRTLGYVASSLVGFTYLFHIDAIFETLGPRLAIKTRLDFSGQICSSELAKDGSVFLVQAFPEIDAWRMSVPRRFIDTSKCGTLTSGDTGVADSNDPYTLRPSRSLSVDSPIRLVMTPLHQHTQLGLRRIGVMFGTGVRANPGDAELRLKGPRGATFVHRFSLPDLADHQYRFFDLDAKRYTAGEIMFGTGGGVSAWEGHDSKGRANTCIVYEYEDGTRRHTPGCP